MAVELVLARLDWTMEQGVFVQWLKQDGDAVQPGDLIYVIENDKTTVEVENFEAGILRIPPDAPTPGQTIKVGARLGYVVQPGEALPFATPGKQNANPQPAESHVAASPSVAQAAPHRRNTASPRARRAAQSLGVSLDGLSGSGAGGRILERDVRAQAAKPAAAEISASPVARKVAQELGVDLAALAAANPGKRIERAQVEAAAAAAAAAPSGAARQPLAGLRRTIAERLSQTARTVAPVTLTTEADATELVRLREALKAERGDEAPGFNDALIKIAALALRDHPRLNARLEGDEIVSEPVAHIGLAVETERGLLVIVVRDAAARSLGEIAAETRRLIARARAGEATGGDLRGSTFTVSSLGAYGIDAFTPMINAPECAILGVGRIVRKPVVVGERIRARHRITLSLTFDHRLVDGVPAARFLQRITELLEQPYRWVA